MYRSKIFCGSIKLDVDPRRDDDASPMSSYRCMLRPTRMISALRHKSKFNFELKKKTSQNSISNFFKSIFYDSMLKYSWRPFHWCINCQCRADIDEAKVISALRHKSKFEFRTFWKKNQIFGFPCCSTREDFSIDVSITNVGLILTKLRWFQHFSTSQNSNFKLFWKKNQIFGFPCCSTREDLSIDVSITNVGLILTKLRWFQHFSTSQNSNFELFWKKIKFLGFHVVVLVKTFPLMYQLLM